MLHLADGNAQRNGSGSHVLIELSVRDDARHSLFFGQGGHIRPPDRLGSRARETLGLSA
jgi:hypothetical protein